MERDKSIEANVMRLLLDDMGLRPMVARKARPQADVANPYAEGLDIPIIATHSGIPTIDPSLDKEKAAGTQYKQSRH